MCNEVIDFPPWDEFDSYGAGGKDDSLMTSIVHRSPLGGVLTGSLCEMCVCSSPWWPTAVQHHLRQQALLQLDSCKVTQNPPSSLTRSPFKCLFQLIIASLCLLQLSWCGYSLYLPNICKYANLKPPFYSFTCIFSYISQLTRLNWVLSCLNTQFDFIFVKMFLL